MRIATNLQHAGNPNDLRNRPFGRKRKLVVGLDCEWTKNYRVKNGNRLFCYSFSYIPMPVEPCTMPDALQRVGFRSVYVDAESELDDLLALLDEDLGSVLQASDLLTGHQLCADLSVALANARTELGNVEAAKQMWSDRRTQAPPRIFDSRFDLDPGMLSTDSRRLVDVCECLGLGVQQPELLRASMTALQRDYLESGADDIYERVAVLNLRHGLSSAVLALIGLGLVQPEPFNLNTVLRQHLWDQFSYVDSQDFELLVR